MTGCVLMKICLLVSSLVPTVKKVREGERERPPVVHHERIYHRVPVLITTILLVLTIDSILGLFFVVARPSG